MGTWGSGTVSLGWPCVVWAEDPPGAPKSQFGSWLFHGGRAVVVVHGQRPVPGVAAQPVAPAPRPCHVQAGTRAKANRGPGSPGSGSRSVPPWPWGSPWPPALLSPQCLAAAERSSVLPRGPWPQIRRGARLAAAPRGSRLPRSWGAAPGRPVEGTWCSAPRRQPLRVASWPCGWGWWLPVSGVTTPGCGTGTAPAGRGATSHPCGGLGPDRLPGGRRELSRAGAMGLAAAGAPGDAAAR